MKSEPLLTGDYVSEETNEIGCERDLQKQHESHTTINQCTTSNHHLKVQIFQSP